MSVVAAVLLCTARLSPAAEPPQAEVGTADLADAGPLESDSGVRWGAGAGGMLVRADTWDYAVVALLRAFVPRKNWDLGGSLTLYLAVDPSSYAEGVALDADATHWVTDTYGWGLSAGVGGVNFTGRHPNAIWVGQALSAQAFIKPVVLRFGSKPRLEAALNLGAIEYFGWDWKPFAFLSFTFDG
jgi:hypothetical protein